MNDIKQLMQKHYITYASYVILDRAIPHLDGLKPVQRRILHTLSEMDDGKLHKVANVAGQTMALHPHGDGPIIDALVNMANKNYLLDRQGNFGNIFTGDPAAAARYIETRLSPLAKETVFNKDLTQYVASYDGRHEEPILLPVKIPLILLQGIDGIAVGMATHILPHNFQELLEAQIAILQNKAFTILPDFPTGGLMDASDYQKGKGKVKLRAKIEIRDPKTIVITQICYGTTTESVIKSIEEAAKKGKIKIESIHDYTADRVEIEIKLPRGSYAAELLNSLYAYTECEINISSQMIVIRDHLPWETDVNEILNVCTENLITYLKLELDLELQRCQEKIFDKSLEQIFIENRLYLFLEELNNQEDIHLILAEKLMPFHESLSRVPLQADREKLLNIPIRRISRFDRDKNQTEISHLRAESSKIEEKLKNMTKVTIRYLQYLIKKYGENYPRLTEIKSIETLDMRAMETKTIKARFDPNSGFFGTKVAGEHEIECTNFDKILIFFSDGIYQVINLPEKQYLYHESKQVIWIGVADKTTVMTVVYKELASGLLFVKRFIISKFILDKKYRFFEEECQLEFISTKPSIVAILEYYKKPKQPLFRVSQELSAIPVKDVSSKGIKLLKQKAERVSFTDG